MRSLNIAECAEWTALPGIFFWPPFSWHRSALLITTKSNEMLNHCRFFALFFTNSSHLTRLCCVAMFSEMGQGSRKTFFFYSLGSAALLFFQGDHKKQPSKAKCESGKGLTLMRLEVGLGRTGKEQCCWGRAPESEPSLVQVSNFVLLPTLPSEGH